MIKSKLFDVNYTKRVYKEKDKRLESATPKRNEFQRDRDRIIHSRTFKRLQGKTQVFSPSEGDHFRNRLTHTLEVTQIARSIAVALNIDENLTEAIALGHDVGHTPFGHAGERALNDLLSNPDAIVSDENKICLKGGFKHNVQSLYVLTNLETAYDDFKGLNLTFAVREGILKHTGFNKENVINYSNDFYVDDYFLDYKFSVTLAGQVVSIADEIAQSTHDLEDSVRADMIDIDKLILNINDFLIKLQKESISNELIKAFIKDFEKKYVASSIYDNKEDLEVRVRNNLIRDLINLFISDVIINTKDQIANNKIEVRDEIVLEEQIVNNSKHVLRLREFIQEEIRESTILSQKIAQNDSKAYYIIREVIKAYHNEPKQLPDYILERYFINLDEEKLPESVKQSGTKLNRKSLNSEFITYMQKDEKFLRLIADHISGMTDNYLIEEYQRLYVV